MDLQMLVLLYGFIVLGGLLSIPSLMICLDASSRRSEDTSHLQPVPPKALQPMVQLLIGVGFRRFGETQTKIPTRFRPGVTWIFLSHDGAVTAEIAETMPNFVQFETGFADKSVVQTMYPTGERINAPDFRVHTVTSNAADAYRHHLREMADFGRQHGAPVKFENMTQLLAFYAYYRQHYVKRLFRRYELSAWLQLGCVGYSVIATLAILGLYWSGLAGINAPNLIAGLCLANLPAALASALSAPVTLLIGKRPSKPS